MENLHNVSSYSGNGMMWNWERKFRYLTLPRVVSTGGGIGETCLKEPCYPNPVWQSRAGLSPTEGLDTVGHGEREKRKYLSYFEIRYPRWCWLNQRSV